MNSTKQMLKKGDDGESALNAWFNKQGLGFVHISQSKDTFATLFTEDVKRPDFLLLIDSIGLLGIDAKFKKIYEGRVTGTKIDSSEQRTFESVWVSLNDEQSEIRTALAFERIFRIPFWYAFYEPSEDGDKWYWISALKALEVGVRTMNTNKKIEFLNISLTDCVCIQNGDDLGKLYTQRMQSYKFDIA